MPSPLLQLRDIERSFGAVRALKGVSFDLRPGEVHALLGENGAGKSTLIKIITGSDAPDSGSMEVSGEKVERFDTREVRRLGIAAIYQQPALFPDLTVAENIAIALEPAGVFRRIHRQKRIDAARKLLAKIGASIHPETEVRHLSMPEQQLVEIAKALGAGARILLMDEPTASLTSKDVEMLLAVVRELRAQGVGIVYISHRLEEIFQIADRVTVLRDGDSMGTHDIAKIDERQLIRLMVGREVSSSYPSSQCAPGRTILSLCEATCGSAGVSATSFELRGGEILGFAGLVGAGRTELARMLFGITPADGGEIILKGAVVRIRSPRDAVRLGIGYVPEDRRRHGVILEMPIAANMTMAIHRRIFPFGWLRKSAETSLATRYARELHIKAASIEALGNTLSGGNQQKVALARWLAINPKVLILDEPTQGVDVGAKTEIHKIIRQLATAGVGIILISSDLPEVMGMSDRIAVMRAGKLVTIMEGRGADPHDVMAAALGRGLTESRAA